MNLFLGRETDNGYEPPLIHHWLKPKISGNVINGLGETEERLPTPVYHRNDKKHPWFALQILFYIRQAWDFIVMSQLRRSGLFIKKQPAYGEEVSELKVTNTPEGWTGLVKSEALKHRFCEAVTITELTPDLYFDWDYEQGQEIPRSIIVLAKRMDYDKFSQNAIEQDWRKLPFWKRRSVESMREIIRCYADVLEAAIDLATWIRDKGYPAECVGGPPGSKINMLKTALKSGLGELGKHGSMIHDELGSSFRLACVLTDMPLVHESPREFGADDFCTSCQLCTRYCPPRAISDKKQMVRGVMKWYVDFDKCVTYMNDVQGCGICLTVCPWSRPGVAPTLAQKMLKKRQGTKQIL